MKDRIRQIMEWRQMSQTVFADFLGQSPATISGIFTGRTRPTLNIVEAIKERIPEVSTDWLLFGKGEMLASQSDDSSPAGAVPSPSGSSVAQEQSLFFAPTGASEASRAPSAAATAPQNRTAGLSSARPLADIAPEVARPKRQVTEIRVFYDDQTWESFVPTKK